MNAIPNNLPAQVSSFIGREREIADVKRLLGLSRLVTLTGAGGCGKTRLALQVGAALCGNHPWGDVLPEPVCHNGVWLVELASLADSSLLPQRVADALDIREHPARTLMNTLKDELRDKRLILILDNCEHMVEPCALAADALLRSCPDLQIIATSREALNIAGEITYLVPPLEGPRSAGPLATAELAQYDAVRLFVARAVAAQPQFALTPENADAIVHICSQLDGMPLAIELAAARTRALSVQTIAARLDDRFRLLTGGSRSELPRQQSLQATMDWSYASLSEPERALFRRLSVFVGGWTLEDAEDTCSDDADTTQGQLVSGILDYLSQLVSKSLVQLEQSSGGTCYRMLETVRVYAHERLVESGEFAHMQARHFASFDRLAAEAESQLKGPQQLKWLNMLELEHDNLRAALAYRPAGIEHRIRLALNLSWFWNLHSHLREGRRWLLALLEEFDAEAPAPGDASRRSYICLAAGMLASVQDDLPAARALLEPAIRVFREANDRHGLASALGYLGITSYWQGRMDEAHTALHESIQLFRAIGDHWGLALALHNMGWIARHERDYAALRRLNEESLARFGESGDRWAQTMPLGSLGAAAQYDGNGKLAERHFAESLAIQREFADRQGIAWTLISLGSVALRASNFAQAELLYGESLALYRQSSNRGIMIGIALLGLGSIALHEADHPLATVRFEEALSIFRETEDKTHVADALERLGKTHVILGDLKQARAYYRESLQIRAAAGIKFRVALSLHSFAALALVQNEAEWAIKLFGAAQALSAGLRDTLLPMDRAEHDAALQRLQAHFCLQFDELWADGQTLTLDQAIAFCEQDALPGGHAGTAPSRPGSLTTREVEVLQLIAKGLTNKQVAAQLVISIRTVDAHMRSIYGKLDVTSRLAAAHYATEHHLV